MLNNNQLYTCNICGLQLSSNQGDAHSMAHSFFNQENSNNNDNIYEFDNSEALSFEDLSNSTNIESNYIHNQILNIPSYNNIDYSFNYNPFYPQEIFNNNCINNILKKLKVYTITEDINKFYGEICIICLDNYNIQDKYIIFPCKHFFHEFCIKKWLFEKQKCPICSFDLNYNNII